MIMINRDFIQTFVTFSSIGPQSGYPPPSGYPQYPPPYPGPAMENAPPLATKSSDYGQQPAFNPNA